jgi:hypothetical protein
MKCAVCHCTELQPCNPPCRWAQPNLCSTCHAALDTLLNWSDQAREPRIFRLLDAWQLLMATPKPMVVSPHGRN